MALAFGGFIAGFILTTGARWLHSSLSLFERG